MLSWFMFMQIMSKISFRHTAIIIILTNFALIDTQLDDDTLVKGPLINTLPC